MMAPKDERRLVPSPLVGEGFSPELRSNSLGGKDEGARRQVSGDGW
jgi:hypothetical protein